MTALGYHLMEHRDFSALVIGPGGGRDLASALVFGALSGVYPAWRMSRLHPVHALKGATR